MKWLSLPVCVLAAPTIAGSAMIALLTAGTDSRTAVSGRLAAFVIVVPVALMVARSIRNSAHQSR